MNIVHVSDCYAPRVGGIETQVADLAAHQARAGHEVHVLTATAAEPHVPHRFTGSTTTGDGVLVHRLATPLALGVPVHPAGTRLLREQLATIAPDVVHVHAGVLSPFAYQGARVAREANLPLAITWHCMLDGVEPVLRRGARVLGWDGESAALSAVSEVAAARVAVCFPVEGSPGEVGVLPNGLDLAAWRPLDSPAPEPGVGEGETGGATQGPLRLIATQRIAPRKRTGVLVDVVAQALAELGPDAVRLTVAGDGSERAKVERQAARRGVAHAVDFLGRVPRTKLQALYAEHDVFISPATLEAFGIAALEARTAGLPVLALAGTGITSFVTDGVDGLIVADDAGLAHAVVTLVREPDLLARLSAHNRAVAPAAGWTDVLAAAEREYARARRLVRFRP